VGLLAALACFAAWLGAFAPVEIREQEIGPYTFAYRELENASVTDVGRVTESLAAELARAGATGLRPLGVYAPDGSAQIGVAIEGGAEKLAALGDVEVRELTAQRGMVAEFPWRMPLSFVVYRASQGYEIAPAWVLQDGGLILNMMPIERRSP